MTLRRVLRAAYVFVSGLFLLLVCIVMMSATTAQAETTHSQHPTGTTSATTIQWDLSTLTSLITIASVLVAVGIFIQQSRSQNEKIGELKDLISKSNEDYGKRMSECRLECEKHRSHAEVGVNGVKSDVIRQITIIHEDFKNSLERMWLKYEKLESDMIEMKVKAAEK